MLSEAHVWYLSDFRCVLVYLYVENLKSLQGVLNRKIEHVIFLKIFDLGLYSNSICAIIILTSNEERGFKL